MKEFFLNLGSAAGIFFDNSQYVLANPHGLCSFSALFLRLNNLFGFYDKVTAVWVIPDAFLQFAASVYRPLAARGDQQKNNLNIAF